MYWHVQGMKCKYKGEVFLNNEKYIVHPETSYGYQDKNWGKDYTNPWIWLNCNNFKSKQQFCTREDDLYVYWDVLSENRKYRIDLKFYKKDSNEFKLIDELEGL